MKIDAVALTPTLQSAPVEAAAAETAGYGGWLTAETGHDAMLLAALAGQATSGIEIGTGIAVAFARNPMTLAYQANDVQELTQGRFILGLGSQIQAHITKRFSMPWSSPAARMREYVLALKAIWRCWNEGEPLRFEGEFYRHTLMNPLFQPAPHSYGPPPVMVAAVGPKMTEVAAEAADGVLCHAFTTQRYLEEVTLPAVERGIAAAGKQRGDVTVGIGTFAVTGRTEEERATVRAAACSQLSFYGSTPAYRPVLEMHGWGDLQTELNTLSKQGRWTDMAALIDDEILDAFALVVDSPDDLGTAAKARFGHLADRFSLYPTYNPDAAALASLTAALS